MERTLDVRTGESVAIRYELAGLGSRFIAVAIDIGMQLGVTIVVFVALLVLAKPIGFALATLALPPKVAAIAGWSILTLAIFVVFFGYFIAFELAWSGRTPGKRMMGLRVVRDAGFPIDIGSAVIRNLVRTIEFTFGLYAISAGIVLVSRENKRLGDFAAGTIVVRERTDETSTLDAYIARERAPDDGLSTDERSLIERFIARRAQLEPTARRTLAAHIATRVRPHLRATFDHLEDEALLEHLGRGADSERR